MKKLKIGHLEISDLVLGGGKLVDTELADGILLCRKALSLGINCFDAHHRYGNAEEIFGCVNDVVKMTKISVYQEKDKWRLLNASLDNLLTIDILWISDLDNPYLYNVGKKMYEEIEFDIKAITTESANLAYKFMLEVPSCKNFMLPVFEGSGMENFIADAKKQGKRIFAIKVLDDGRQLQKKSIKECFKYARNLGVDAVVIGTNNAVHLEDDVVTWNLLEAEENKCQ